MNESAFDIPLINPFHISDIAIYPLKTSENRRFLKLLKGYRNGRTLA